MPLVVEFDRNPLGESLGSAHYVDAFVFYVFFRGKTQFGFSTGSFRFFRQFQNRIGTRFEMHFQPIEAEMENRSHGLREAANARIFPVGFFNSGG